ncbi:MAG: hypothetical protein ACRD1C_03770 [Terriglobales bacterium]
MNSQGLAVLDLLELARDGAAGPARTVMLGDGSITLEFVEQEGSVRIHRDGRVDQIWRDGAGLHSQLGERKEKTDDMDS